MTEIGDYIIYSMKPVPKIGRGTFRYYLTSSELLIYMDRYNQHPHDIKRRHLDLFITHHFAEMRQAVYNKVKNNAYKGSSDEELMEMIIDLEKEYAKNSELEYLGIENKVRREALLRNVKLKK